MHELVHMRRSKQFNSPSRRTIRLLSYKVSNSFDPLILYFFFIKLHRKANLISLDFTIIIHFIKIVTNIEGFLHADYIRIVKIKNIHQIRVRCRKFFQSIRFAIFYEFYIRFSEFISKIVLIITLTTDQLLLKILSCAMCIRL